MTTPPPPPHNPELKDFLASLSHELRTPLSGILGYSTLLLKRPVSLDEQREGLEVIQKSGFHLLALINNLLDFAKLEAGKLELNLYPTDVRAYMEHISAQMVTKTNERNLKFVKNIASDMPLFVLVDANRLWQVLQYLLDNAVKFTAEGEIAVEVTVETRTTETDLTLHFAVRDTGQGIPADELSFIFTPYSRGAQAVRTYGGLGLGLANSYRLVNLMGGRLWAESAGIEGPGSTFHFTLPTQICAAPPATTTAPEPSEFSEPEFATNHPLAILVVDGSGLVTRPLKQLGYSVDTVASGLEALGLWQQQAYALVFINVNLHSSYSGAQLQKAHSGLETARQLCKIHPLFHPHRPQPYLIALEAILKIEN